MPTTVFSIKTPKVSFLKEWLGPGGSFLKSSDCSNLALLSAYYVSETVITPLQSTPEAVKIGYSELCFSLRSVVVFSPFMLGKCFHLTPL